MKNISDKGKTQMRFNFTLQEGGIRSYSTKLNVFQKAVLQWSSSTTVGKNYEGVPA